MEKTIQTFMRCACALIIIVIGSYVIVAQNTITGTWSTEDSSNWKNKNKDKIKIKTKIEMMTEILIGKTKIIQIRFI